MIMISHSKTLTSSMSPAEKPSMGFRLSSAAVDARWVGTSESEGRGAEPREKKGDDEGRVGRRRGGFPRVFRGGKPLDLVAGGL